MENIVDKTKNTLIRKACPQCGKVIKEKSRTSISETEEIVSYECNHSFIQEKVKHFNFNEVVSVSGKKPFDFQYETIKFIEDADFSAGVFHEQGVGKTICALATIAKHKDKLLPCVIVCKSSLKVQWWKETLDWTGLPAQLIMSSHEKPFPNYFKIFIISYDLLSSKNPFEGMGIKLVILDECQQIKNTQAKRTQGIRNLIRETVLIKREFSEKLRSREKIEMIAKDLMKWHRVSDHFTLNFEKISPDIYGLCECHPTKEGMINGRITINKDHAENDSEEEVIDTILHEIAHAITPGAGHSDLWKGLAKNIGASPEATKMCHGSIKAIDQYETPIKVIALSGTPIKNNAGEYFPVLNMLRPTRFPGATAFETTYCDVYSSGYGTKVGGLSKDGAPLFHEMTKDFIIRFEREKVMPELPRIFRKNYFVELGAEVEAMYKEAYKKFQEAYLEGDDYNATGEDSIIARLNRLRHITGIAKVKPITAFMRDFLEGYEKEKFVIFVHHKDVGLSLYNNINKLCTELNIQSPLQLTSENAASDAGYKIDEKFKSDPLARIMIASTLSSGEGKNWQMCSNAMLAERQWNPANEEQPETRFPRFGSTAESISITYAIALGTPDEYLTQVIEGKRELCRKAYGHEAVEWNQTSVIKEMSDLLFSMGGKRWNL